VARPAHVKVFTAEETDRAGRIKAIYMQLHCVVRHIIPSPVSPVLSLCRASLVPHSRRRRSAWNADCERPIPSRGIVPNCRMLSALTKVSLALEIRRCAGQESRVIESRERIPFQLTTNRFLLRNCRIRDEIGKLIVCSIKI